MRLLVFQHIDCEHPGSLRALLKNDNVDWHAVRLNHGEEIPPFENFDALWVLGGPMDVWDDEEYPWLVNEKIAIRQWVKHLNKPFLGFCLGHQLLADALGGTCGPQKPAEIGILDVQLTAKGLSDPAFKGMDEHQKCLQWHSVCVAQPPEGATVLASSDDCKVQAMRIGNAVSMQYHVEIEPDTISNWAAVPTYHEALLASIGKDGFNQMQKAADRHLPSMFETARLLYGNFSRSV